MKTKKQEETIIEVKKGARRGQDFPVCLSHLCTHTDGNAPGDCELTQQRQGKTTEGKRNALCAEAGSSESCRM